jgi:hypothetical protein
MLRRYWGHVVFASLLVWELLWFFMLKLALAVAEVSVENGEVVPPSALAIVAAVMSLIALGLTALVLWVVFVWGISDRHTRRAERVDAWDGGLGGFAPNVASGGFPSPRGGGRGEGGSSCGH